MKKNQSFFLRELLCTFLVMLVFAATFTSQKAKAENTGGGVVIIIDDTDYCVRPIYNPIQDKMISMRAIDEKAFLKQITISTLEGQVRISQNFDANEGSLDVNELTVGTYILTAITDACQVDYMMIVEG